MEALRPTLSALRFLSLATEAAIGEEIVVPGESFGPCGERCIFCFPCGEASRPREGGGAVSSGGCQ